MAFSPVHARVFRLFGLRELLVVAVSAFALHSSAFAEAVTDRATPAGGRTTLSAPPVSRADGWIALRIRGLLLVRSKVSAANTHVVVQDGVVTLTGFAEDGTQKALTETYTRSVEGVKAVRNELQLRAPASEEVAVDAEQ